MIENTFAYFLPTQYGVQAFNSHFGEICPRRKKNKVQRSVVDAQSTDEMESAMKDTECQEAVFFLATI
jgi:hypothetical protein